MNCGRRQFRILHYCTGREAFEPLTQALETPQQFAVFLLGLWVVQVHLLMQGREQGARREASAALFLNAAIDQPDIPAVREAGAIKEAALQQLAEQP
jgi:hypothetical protein